MKKSLAFRVISGVIVASTLLILPATATAAVQELTSPADRAAQTPAGGASPSEVSPSGASRGGASPGGASVGSAASRQKASSDAKPLPGVTVVPFRLAVPGAVASGTYTAVKGGASQLTVTLKVTGRAPCGVLQTTRNGPADGVEWHTVGALCNPGTATFRTEVNRLWGSRALPSVRLCNGDSLGLAEGVDCDDYVPRRTA